MYLINLPRASLAAWIVFMYFEEAAEISPITLILDVDFAQFFHSDAKFLK